MFCQVCCIVCQNNIITLQISKMKLTEIYYKEIGTILSTKSIFSVLLKKLIDFDKV